MGDLFYFHFHLISPISYSRFRQRFYLLQWNNTDLVIEQSVNMSGIPFEVSSAYQGLYSLKCQPVVFLSMSLMLVDQKASAGQSQSSHFNSV